MYKKLVFVSILLSVLLVGCTSPQDSKRFKINNIEKALMESGQLAIFGEDGKPNPELGILMRKKIDEVCISGVMQTGSIFFQEFSKASTSKMEKLIFIKAKLDVIAKKGAEESKEKINTQTKILEEIIQEIKLHNEKIKKDPNSFCNKTYEFKDRNENIRKKMMGLSEDIEIIHKYEKRKAIIKKATEWFGLKN